MVVVIISYPDGSPVVTMQEEVEWIVHVCVWHSIPGQLRHILRCGGSVPATLGPTEPQG